ncbi:MAG: hypothetical protein H6581_28160 [Bacteroidia bacterium]|nr:hypothetical protein [Bacteroidia bacterium]
MQVGLLDLLAPHFLAGFDLPDSVNDIISFLRVSELQTAWDDSGVVYSGKAIFVGEGDASPVPRYHTPSGSLWEWEDVNLRFRLTVPRQGSAQIRSAMTTAVGLPTVNPGDPIDQLNNALNRLEVNTTTLPSDYPGFQWQLEMLLTAITLHIPKDVFLPAKLAADGWLEPDRNHENVKLTLPKIAFVVSQGANYGSVTASFRGWGINSLDDPSDPAAGELIRMEPPIALHESGVFGFGLDKAILDLSDGFTPPEILELFGVGDDFQGLWLPHVRLFVAPNRTTGFAFDLRANDLLIDFEGVVSGEFALDIIRRNSKLKVEPILYEGDLRRHVTRGNTSETATSVTVTGSRASVAADGELQISISGGMAPYNVEVTLNGTPLTSQLHNGDVNRPYWPLDQPSSGSATLVITVTDSTNPTHFTWTETIALELAAPGTVTGTETDYPAPVLVSNPCAAGYSLDLMSPQSDHDAVFLRANPSQLVGLSIDGTPVATLPTNGEIRVPVTAGGPVVTVEAQWTGAPIEPFIGQYTFDKPSTTAERVSFESLFQSDSRLLTFLQQAGASPIIVEGNASYEGNTTAEGYNESLSGRRLLGLVNALNATASANGLPAPNITVQNTFGTARARPATTSGSPAEQPDFEGDPNFSSHPILGNVGSSNEANYNPQYYWTAIARVNGVGANVTCSVQVSRPSPVTTDITTPTERGPTPQEPERPPVFRSIGFRVRLERNLLVLAEVKGELDFQLESERLAERVQTNGSQNVAVNTNSGASESGAQGILDYRLTLTYDSAAKKLTQQLALGFDRENPSGWLYVEGFNPAPVSNSIGALAIFAPLLASSIETAVTAEGGEAIAAMVISGAEIAIAIALGATGALEMKKFIFYGAELSASQTLPGYMEFEGATFDELGVLLDYAIDFEIHINLGPISINSTPGKPLRVRYKAIGFKVDFNTSSYHPVFDTSRGYQFDLADPGLFDIGAPLGNILKILGARVSRLNPLLLEFDIGLKINLGVISVDSFRVTLPIDDPTRGPSIIPTGASVNIPGALIGSGYVDLRNGIKGQLDLTIVPVKLRISAGVGIESITADDGRKLTAVIVGLMVEFPAAIPIGGTGLGLFGILGLFAMHYRRNETTDPSITVPALHWLNNAPVNGNPVNIQGWVADADKWAFGAGVVLGSMEGGVLINLKGMFMLELPGPRILIFVNAKILSERPGTEGKVTTGVLAVVDLDFARKRLTIGLIVDYSVEKVISVKIPVEALFSFDDVTNWHLYIGQISARVTADVLGLVKAEGYFMIAGHEIANFPWLDGGTKTLPGFAVALGIRASIILGKESSGIYLKVSASLDVGLSFNPFKLYGLVDLRGELRLLIISISAWATLAVEAPDPTYLEGKACGKVDFFFFSIKGCVKVRIGDKPPLNPPPPLVRGMILQSRSPALIEGSGSDRPIDGSLGEAYEVTAVGGSVPTDERLVVPIDSMPVFNLHAAPQASSGFTSFTLNPGQAPRMKPGGWIELTPNLSVRYELQSISIDPPLPASTLGLPPATWRSFTGTTSDSDTSVDLALMSWMPEHFTRAMERSQELTDRLTHRWGDICDEVAPPACILWNFLKKPLGYSENGWDLYGIKWPDPPNTVRSAEPDNHIWVHEDQGKKPSPLLDQIRAEMKQSFLDHAKVIGGGYKSVAGKLVTARVLELPFEYHTVQKSDLNIPKQFNEFLPKETQKIIVESDCVNRIFMLVALPLGKDQQTIPVDWVIFRAIDAKNQVVEEVMLKDIIAKVQPVMTDYPINWQDAAGPWQGEVSRIHDYLAIVHRDLTRFLLKWEPKKEMVRFEIVVEKRQNQEPPSLLLAIMEMCTCEEMDRYNHDSVARDTDIQTVETALLGEQLRQLLEPDTQYTISMSYKAQVEETDKDGAKTVQDFSDTQHFSFFTDDEAPERLDPWILTTTPDPENPYFFTEDAIRIFFTDASAVQLWEAYGKTLKAVIRNANGDHPDEQPEITQDLLEAIDAQILTPFQETLSTLVSAMDCVTEGVTEEHRVFRIDIPLERGTSYTLDVEVDPEVIGADPKTPLFRVAFRTSRFTGAAELADYILKAYVDERALSANLALLDEEPSDAEIQQALLDAGMEALPPSDQPGMTLLWQAQGNNFRLKALLIDSPEPLWRYRNEPEQESITTDTGPMTRWVMERTRYLELAESGTSSVQRFVRSPGGTRTLVMLKNNATDINLVLRQHEIGLEGGATTDHTLLGATLPSDPVWVLNEIED